jgi:tripartite-type tricarboxylate transporter receptor subunit TctC
VYAATYGTTRARVKTGKVRALAVSGLQRTPILPEVPTFRELGYAGLSLGVWNAVFVPSAAPRPAIQKLQDAMARVNASPEMKAQLDKMEFEAWPGTLEQFMAHIRAEGEAAREDIRRLKLPMQD